MNEWTLDEWHEDYSGAPNRVEDPWGNISSCEQTCDGESSGAGIRGGSWGEFASSLRVASRKGYDLHIRTNTLGFRVSRRLP